MTLRTHLPPPPDQTNTPALTARQSAIQLAAEEWAIAMSNPYLPGGAVRLQAACDALFKAVGS